MIFEGTFDVDFSYAEITDPLAPILAEFTYKPGWTFKSWVRHGLLTFQMAIEADDADAPGETIGLSFTNTVDLRLHNAKPREYWIKWLHNCVRLAEEHECDEFFQIGGVKVFDPHSRRNNVG